MQPEKQTFIQKIMNAITPASTQIYTRKEPVLPPLDMAKFMAAIAQNETGIVKGDRYKYSKPSGDPKLGRDLGLYQVTEGTLGTYGPRFLGGQKVSGDQFLASSTAQDNFVKNMAEYYNKQGYTAQQIADIHRRGFRKSSDPGSDIYQDPDYVNKFNQIYNATTTGSQAGR